MRCAGLLPLLAAYCLLLLLLLLKHSLRRQDLVPRLKEKNTFLQVLVAG
jgi:hypothetical protein